MVLTKFPGDPPRPYCRLLQRSVSYRISRSYLQPWRSSDPSVLVVRLPYKSSDFEPSASPRSSTPSDEVSSSMVRSRLRDPSGTFLYFIIYLFKSYIYLQWINSGSYNNDSDVNRYSINVSLLYCNAARSSFHCAHWILLLLRPSLSLLLCSLLHNCIHTIVPPSIT